MAARPFFRGFTAVGVAAFTAIAAQAQTPPPRDRPQIQATGTGRIKGRVVDAVTGSAIARARVRLSVSGPSGNPSRSALTDGDGLFEFADLPAGQVFLSAEKPGYGMTRYPEPARTVRGNRRVVIADRETLTGITIPLYRGAAITGRVIDAHGDPAESMQVQLLRIPSSGRGAPQPRGGVSTNDLGEFRIPKLEPGSYLLLALNQRNQPDDPVETQPLPTYYPGVLALDQAQPIVVERGQTVAGIELVLLEGTASTVSGTVVDANGQPATNGSIQVRHVGGGVRDYGSFGGPVRPDGTFQLKLAPGEYELEARGTRRGPGVIGPMQPGDELYGIASVSVAGAPVSDVAIRLAAGARLSGRIVFDGDAAPPSDPQQFRLGLNPSREFICRMGRAEVAADWTFRIDGAFGTCMMPVPQIGRWIVKSATHRDVSLLDQPFRLVPGQTLRDVQIVMTDRRTELTLDVTDDRGLSTREYVALVFSQDKTKWNEMSRYIRTHVPQTAPRATPSATMTAGASRATPGAGANGTATVQAARPERPDTISALPPGEYYAVAVDDLSPEGMRDPSLLEALVGDAVRVTLRESEPARVSLRRRALR